MPSNTTSNLTNSVQALYLNKYLMGAKAGKLYDQISVDYTAFSNGKSMAELMKGTSVSVPFLSQMRPALRRSAN